MLSAGTYLQNRYEILEQIGAGGMSYVYKARCHTLNRLVAVKVLREEFARDAAFVEKFKMEAQAAARLAHPNIVNVYDVVDEGEMHYIVMELIDGITLKHYIEKKGPLETREAVGIALQVAQGIAAAHEHHIIHRDIKPQNMIIARDGKVKVADFGIARAVSSQTVNAQAVGSVHYISPEQAKGEFCDERSDIYSFGITLYELVTGQVPFTGENTVTVALSHLNEPVTPPSQLNPKVGLAAEEIILKCTQKKPERRYASMEQVIEDLRKALVNPDSDLMAAGEGAGESLGDTKTLTQEEMGKIHAGSHRSFRQRPPKGEGEEKVRGGRPGKSHLKGTGPVKVKEEPEDVSRQFQRIFTGLLVAAAILLAATVLFLGARVLGLFGMGTSGGSDLSATAPVTAPPAVTITDNQARVPNILGKTQEEASRLLEENGGLTLEIKGADYSDTYSEGQIMGQDAAEGEVVAKGSVIGATISKGSDTVKLLELKLAGMTAGGAKKLLEDQGLKAEVKQEYSETVEKDRVIRFSPETAKVGDTVTLTVSQGPAVTEGKVPLLTGKTEEEAMALLSQVNLTAGEVSREANEAPAGQVILQEYMADTMLAPGTPVGFTVSLGPEGTEAGAETLSQEEGKKRYIGSIDTTCDLGSYIGPASQTSEVMVAIRLKQKVADNQYNYTTLIPAHRVVGGQTIPVSISRIEGAYGVDTGEIEVVDSGTNKVIASYPISFFPVE